MHFVKLGNYLLVAHGSAGATNYAWGGVLPTMPSDASDGLQGIHYPMRSADA